MDSINNEYMIIDNNKYQRVNRDLTLYNEYLR